MSRFYLSLFCFSLGFVLQARAADLTQLASDPTWLGLIQVHGGIKTGPQDFYWAGQAKTAEQELAASLNAVLDPLSRPAFACRFPARFYFLAYRLNLTQVNDQLVKCEKLKTTIELERIDGISLVLVGSYLSNPASSFGHTLLRLHQRSKDGLEKDLSFNYGALIPPRENVLTYITKGIFGHYEASYSDQDPFIHDITYNHLENRDSWSLKSKHTPEDRILIALHLWEMSGVKFQYFFFSRNCAWQMANTLRLTLRSRQVEQREIPFWTLPVDVVHELQDQGLLEEGQHIPSHQRQLNSSLAQLGAHEAESFLKKINGGDALDSSEDSPKLMNAVIDYYTWRNAGNALKSEQDRRYIYRREQAIQARLQLPPDSAVQSFSPEPSPSDGNKPVKLVVGYQNRPEISWSVYSQGPLDPHALGIGHMRALVFDMAMLSTRLQLERFIFLDIERIQDKDPFHLNGFSPSWRIKLDMQRKDGLKPYAKVSLGWSHVDKAWSASIYGDVSLSKEGLRASPSISLVHRGERMQSIIEISEIGLRTAASQYQINKSYFLGVGYDKLKKDSMVLSVGRYW